MKRERAFAGRVVHDGSFQVSLAWLEKLLADIIQHPSRAAQSAFLSTSGICHSLIFGLHRLVAHLVGGPAVDKNFLFELCTRKQLAEQIVLPTVATAACLSQ